MGYLSHFFVVVLCSVFVFYTIQSRLEVIQEIHDKLESKVNTFADDMGPWHKRIFHDTPEWIKANIVVERSRIGAVNSKVTEWLTELQPIAEDGSSPEVFFKLIEYLRRRSLAEWELEHEVEEIQLDELKNEITHLARNINELDPLLAQCEHRDKILSYFLKRAAQLETFFGDGKGELSHDHGTYGEMKRAVEEFKKLEPELRDDLLKTEGDRAVLKDLIENIKSKFERLKRYVTNIGKAQQATIKMALEFTDLLRKVDFIDSQFKSHNKTIMEDMTDKMNEVYTQLHRSGNAILKESEEFGEIDFDEIQKNILLFNEERGEKSRFARDEHDASRLLVFRIYVIQSLIKKYEAGRENNENAIIVEVYDELVHGKDILDERGELLHNFHNDFNKTEFGEKLYTYNEYYLYRHGEAGHTLKMIWQAALDLAWLE